MACFSFQATEVLSLLYAAHQEGKKNTGVDIESHTVAVTDCLEKGILDLFLAKYWGLKFATAAACTVLKVDQVSRSHDSHMTEVFRKSGIRTHLCLVVSLSKIHLSFSIV